MGPLIKVVFARLCWGEAVSEGVHGRIMTVCDCYWSWRLSSRI